MPFCFLSGNCIRSAWAGVALLLELALEERAILAVPSAMHVLRDYLDCVLFARMLVSDDW